MYQEGYAVNENGQILNIVSTLLHKVKKRILSVQEVLTKFFTLKNELRLLGYIVMTNSQIDK